MAQSDRATRSSSEVRSPPWRVVQPQRTSTGAPTNSRGRGRAEVFPDAAGHGGAFGLLQMQRQHEELRPADAGEHVVLAERHRQGAGHRLERGVTGLVAEALVELLHVGDIDEQRVHRCVLPVGELQQLGARCNQAAPVLESGELVAPRQLQQARAELLELALNGHAPAQVAQNAARLRCAAIVAELQRRHLDLNEASVTPPEAGHTDGRSGPLPLRHGDTPARVLLVDQAVPAQGADRLVAHVEHGAGGRVRRHDPTLLGPEEDALRALREQHLVGGQTDRLCSPNHHAVSFL